MKKLLAVFVSLFVVSSVAFAKPSVESDFATMSKADSQFLFQEGAKVASLDQAELKSTEGEGFLGGVIGGLIYTDYQLYFGGGWSSWNQRDFWTAVGVGAGLFPY